jgi:hypothetical protein
MRASSRGVDWEQARQDVILEEEAIWCVLGLGCRAVFPPMYLGLHPSHVGSGCGCPSREICHIMGKIAPRACRNEFHHPSAAWEHSGFSGPCAPCCCPCHQNTPMNY